ncbi:MAG: aspartate/glutamate racemase family protein, partial [Clostridia bacterium]|nr:aspartate/glutamate racemase family protein [Clostridia bacterium]
VPFISMLDETANVCAQAHPGEMACVLATRATLATGLYEEALSKRGVSCILPDEGQRDVLMYAIYDCVKGGKPLETVRRPMEALLQEERAKGADYFILGCTELPIVAQELALQGPFVDPTAELAKAAIRFCGYKINE